jgi:hypothetical protein
MFGRLRTAELTISHGSQAASFLLGGLVLVTAGAVSFLSYDVSAVTEWAFEVLGVGFLTLLGLLLFVALYSLISVNNTVEDPERREYWYSIGMQAANGVTTLALTFTLLGISLGIGSLAAQELTPDTVQKVIRDLTANFSLAFMTTVVGLPVSAVMRALLVITFKKPSADHGSL